jgi:hypothetical protein
MGAIFAIFKKLPRVNNHPMSEFSPNLVTLVPGANPTTSIYNATAL